ncbi:hypothetical protein CROQUDRAFT_652520 [Cronartium quercuum f. sp. fusiforme G11]|uniref:Up-regulated during septation protein 1 domain-containing protein n=1 Tax=Cronartium quercuum f. sp. fusiforme G11 TaxID=708437 RepID=A0A9P6NNC1_9BASI|nr:hypothetical protein CROQUDRAFT_652520 [Cronartium quercuum f. sp. fusiforme G11]
MRRMFGNAFQSATAPTPAHPEHYKPTPSHPFDIASTLTPDHLQALDDEFLPDRLPFGTSRAGSHSARSSPRLQNSHPVASKLARPHNRSESATHTGSSFTARSPASPRHPFSGADLKSKMMLQLLSSQAMIDASTFQILPFSRVEQLKKEQTKLETRLVSISNKIVLEQKIRDATQTMIESGATEEEPKLTQSALRLEQLQLEHHTIHTQLVGIRTQLLQHLSAVLSLSLKKTEHALPSSKLPSFRPEHSPASTARRGSDAQRSPSPSLTDSSSAFDGPHLFANSTYDGLSPSGYQPLLDPGPLRGYEKTIAKQTAELEELRADLVRIRARAEDRNSQRTSEAAQELAKLRTEAAGLAAELERSRVSLDGETQDLVTRARAAEDRARTAESRVHELEADVDRLRTALDTAEESKESVRSELVALQATIARLADQKTDSEKQRQEQQERLEAEKASLVETVERLRAEPVAPVSSAEWDALVNGLDRLGPLADGALAHVKASRPTTNSTTERVRWVGELVAGLEAHFTNLEGSRLDAKTKENSQTDEHARLTSRVAELEAQLAELERAHEQAATALTSSGIAELERLKQEHVAAASASESALESLKSQLQAAQQATSASETELLRARTELSAAQKALEDAGAVEQTLRDLFRTLPPTRARLEVDGDLSTFRSVYEGTSEPVKKSGLGGLFGLSKRAATPALDEADYSLDAFVERARATVESDRRLIERLVRHESEKEVYKANALRATKLAEESREALKTYQQQVKELEERLEYADTQSAAMLERFNDLMESEEKAHGLARRAEASTGGLQAQIATLTAEAESLRKELNQVEDEAEEVRRRARAAEDEMGSLKLKLRQSERKK